MASRCRPIGLAADWPGCRFRSPQGRRSSELAVVKSPSAAVGFACPQATAFPEDSAGFGEVWTDDGFNATKTAELAPPAGLPSCDAFALHASPLGFGAIVAGIGYDETIGRAASSVPACWSFKKSTLGLAWNGTWPPIVLTDDTGAPASGAAMAVTEDVTAIFGHIVKGSVAQACMWPLAGFPASIPATLLGSPPGITASYVNSAGHDGTVAVGYGLSPSGPKAIGYIGGNSYVLKDEINSLFPGTIPSDWDLQEAKAVSITADDLVSQPSLNVLSWAVVGRGTNAGIPEGWVLRFSAGSTPLHSCVGSVVSRSRSSRTRTFTNGPHIFLRRTRRSGRSSTRHVSRTPASTSGPPEPRLELGRDEALRALAPDPRAGTTQPICPGANSRARLWSAVCDGRRRPSAGPADAFSCASRAVPSFSPMNSRPSLPSAGAHTGFPTEERHVNLPF